MQLASLTYTAGVTPTSPLTPPPFSGLDIDIINPLFSHQVTDEVAFSGLWVTVYDGVEVRGR